MTSCQRCALEEVASVFGVCFLFSWVHVEFVKNKSLSICRDREPMHGTLEAFSKRWPHVSSHGFPFRMQIPSGCVDAFADTESGVCPPATWLSALQGETFPALGSPHSPQAAQLPCGFACTSARASPVVLPHDGSGVPWALWNS